MYTRQNQLTAMNVKMFLRGNVSMWMAKTAWGLSSIIATMNTSIRKQIEGYKWA